MSEQEINRAIAEELGWKWKPKGDKYGPLVHPWIAPDKTRQPSLPNFYGDLNAMREAVNRLLPGDRDTYQNWLSRIVDRKHRMATITWLMLTAEAKDQAKAFLRTKGKWKE